MGADPKTIITVGHGVLQVPARILPELRPEDEDGPQSPLFLSKNVCLAYFHKEVLS